MIPNGPFSFSFFAAVVAGGLLGGEPVLFFNQFWSFRQNLNLEWFFGVFNPSRDFSFSKKLGQIVSPFSRPRDCLNPFEAERLVLTNALSTIRKWFAKTALHMCQACTEANVLNQSDWYEQCT